MAHINIVGMRARTGILMILFAALTVSPGCSPESAKIPALNPGDVILAFGNSLTYGTGTVADKSYPAVLSMRTGITVINAGVPGELSGAGRARLPALLEEYAPALLILTHGGNDLLRKHGEREIADNLRAMIRMAEARGSAVILVGVPQLGFGLKAPDFYAAIAEQHALPYAGRILAEVLSDRRLKSDPIHPNAAGYARIAERLHGLLGDAGAL